VLGAGGGAITIGGNDVLGTFVAAAGQFADGEPPDPAPHGWLFT